MGSSSTSIGLSFALALALSGCQYALVPDQGIVASGAQAGGWIEDPDALVLVEAYDDCVQDWREVQRAWVDPEAFKLGPHGGHAWRADLVPASFASPECLFREEDDASTSFRVRMQVHQGDTQRTMPSLGAGGLQCLLDAPWQEESAAQLLSDCETVDSLSLRVESACPPGQELVTQVVPLGKAGNVRRLQDPLAQNEAPLLYHFEDTLLVGLEPPVFGMNREYRNYVLFDRPAVPTKVIDKAQLKAAWISWFSNFERTLCAHREDIGCGYASENAYEDFRLSWVDLAQHPDPRDLAYGLALKDPGPIEAMFAAIQDAPTVGRLRMRAQDVDRWFEIPLEEPALRALRGMEPGQSMMLAGRVNAAQTQKPQTRALLFVDHFVGTSITPELAPRLTLAYCAERSDLGQ